MIASSNAAAVFSRLVQQGRQLAEAAAATQRVDPPLRWRRAALLWPLFTKG
ncbi:MAG: hypothetical protein JSR28_10145 [Proteobacteria bacterium]|nr:hypothetical protein [Pseudomonadota bacterium]